MGSLRSIRQDKVTEDLKIAVARKLKEIEEVAASLGHSLLPWKHDSVVRTCSTYCQKCHDSIYYYYEPDGKFSLALDEALTRRCR